MKYLRLFVIVISFFSVSVSLAGTQHSNLDQVQKNLEKLEKSFNGKIGVYAIDTSDSRIISYRADERFPVQSTCKLIGVSALLKKSEKDRELLQEKIHYTKNDLLFWSPVTGVYVSDNGMTLEALSEAAMSYSDNLAINLIMKRLGGPKIVSDFAHSIGNQSFNIEHYDGNLNSNPKNSDDTSTPKDMAISLQKLTLGDVLEKSQRTQLVTWMRNNTTSYKRMRAGVPMGWVVADKTGGGDFGINNDIGILWSPLCKPIVLAIYTIRNNQSAKTRDEVVASITSTVLNEFSKSNTCFKGIR